MNDASNTSIPRSPRVLDHCETLMLDMDGTVLDLAYDNYMWLTRVPEAYAEAHGLDQADARERLFALYRQMQGTLDWYCLDQWSERLGLDIVALHHAHRERIGYLPGARSFLTAVAQRDIRLLLVTNSHQSTLNLKSEVTGLGAFFDRVYSSHDVGHAKEEQAFWQAVREEEGFDPAATVFVDDTLPVLESAGSFGIRHLQHVTRPDTSQPARPVGAYPGVETLAELLDAD
jgi:putative hydrolase of the HAD superfamily